MTPMAARRVNGEVSRRVGGDDDAGDGVALDELSLEACNCEGRAPKTCASRRAGVGGGMVDGPPRDGKRLCRRHQRTGPGSAVLAKSASRNL
jgi:hypothetical protein